MLLVLKLPQSIVLIGKDNWTPTKKPKYWFVNQHHNIQMQPCSLENDFQNYEGLKVELGNKVEVVDKLKVKMVENSKANAKAFDASQKKGNQ
jgi:hypothetical protein